MARQINDPWSPQYNPDELQPNYEPVDLKLSGGDFSMPQKQSYSLGVDSSAHQTTPANEYSGEGDILGAAVAGGTAGAAGGPWGAAIGAGGAVLSTLLTGMMNKEENMRKEKLSAQEEARKAQERARQQSWEMGQGGRTATSNALGNLNATFARVLT